MTIEDVQKIIPNFEESMDFIRAYLEHRRKIRKRPQTEENVVSNKSPRLEPNSFGEAGTSHNFHDYGLSHFQEGVDQSDISVVNIESHILETEESIDSPEDNDDEDSEDEEESQQEPHQTSNPFLSIQLGSLDKRGDLTIQSKFLHIEPLLR